MKKYTTADRLRQIMKERHLRQIDIVNMASPYCKKYGVKLGRNDLSQYVSGKTEPGQYKLSILGMALNISEAWLMGFDVPPERISPDAPERSTHSISAAYDELNEQGRAELMRYARYLLNCDEYKRR